MKSIQMSQYFYIYFYIHIYDVIIVFKFKQQSNFMLQKVVVDVAEKMLHLSTLNCIACT